MSISHYHYQPLENPREQIRLLTLRPSRDNGSVIITNLSIHKIPRRNASQRDRLHSHLDLPGYWAVSYVWGTGEALEKTHEILVDGRVFNVTAHLHAAIHEFRSTTTSSLRLWVDAICINQADDEEKSAQIPIIRDVYRCSLGTVCWLGCATPESDRVMKFIGDLVQSEIINRIENKSIKLADLETEARDKGSWSKRSLPQKIKSETQRILLDGLFRGLVGAVRTGQIAVDVLQNMGVDNLDDEEEEPVGHLELDREGQLLKMMEWDPSPKALKRVKNEDFKEIGRLIEKIFFSDTEYFNRMWTLQEVCVAWGVSMNRGNHGIEIEDFLRTVYYLRRTLGISTACMEKLVRIQLINIEWTNGRRLSLRNLLYECRERLSTDPRDKVYAVQGLMRDKMNALLQPDYTKPPAEVYANTARHLIIQENSLDILCGHQSQERIEGLPSWAPDFRYFGLENGVSPLIQANGEESIYRASASEKPDFPKHEIVPHPWQHLQVTAIFLGAISWTSQTQLGDALYGSVSATWPYLFPFPVSITQPSTSSLPTHQQTVQLLAIYRAFHQDPIHVTFWTRHPETLQQLRSLTGETYNESSASTSLIPSLSATTITSPSDTAPIPIIPTITTTSTPNLQTTYLQTLLLSRSGPSVRCLAPELEGLMTRACIPDAGGIETLETLCKALESGMKHRRFFIAGDDSLGNDGDASEIGDGVRKKIIEHGNGGEMSAKAEMRFGVVPEGAIEGDLVCVLVGCSVPVVLRKRGGDMDSKGDAGMGGKVEEYEFVGECYVHGFMDGEAIALRDEGKSVSREVVLC